MRKGITTIAILFFAVFALGQNFSDDLPTVAATSRSFPAGDEPGEFDCTTLYFEGIVDSVAIRIGDYYESIGISFTENSLVTKSKTAGGTGNFQYNPSGDEVLFWLTGDYSIINVPSGFTEGFSFYYSSYYEAAVELYSGVNGTGTRLARFSLDVTPPPEDYDYWYENWQPIGVDFAGTAKSIKFIGVENKCGFDNVTFCNSTPCNINVSATASDSIVCSGERVDLSAAFTSSVEPVMIEWRSNPSGFSSMDPKPMGPEITEDTWFIATATNVDGCYDVDSVFVRCIPEIEGHIDVRIIEETEDYIRYSLCFEAAHTESGLDYLWTTGEITDCIEITVSGAEEREIGLEVSNSCGGVEYSVVISGPVTETCPGSIRIISDYDNPVCSGTWVSLCVEWAEEGPAPIEEMQIFWDRHTGAVSATCLDVFVETSFHKTVTAVYVDGEDTCRYTAEYEILVPECNVEIEPDRVAIPLGETVPISATLLDTTAWSCIDSIIWRDRNGLQVARDVLNVQADYENIRNNGITWYEVEVYMNGNSCGDMVELETEIPEGANWTIWIESTSYPCWQNFDREIGVGFWEGAEFGYDPIDAAKSYSPANGTYHHKYIFHDDWSSRSDNWALDYHPYRILEDGECDEWEISILKSGNCDTVEIAVDIDEVPEELDIYLIDEEAGGVVQNLRENNEYKVAFSGWDNPYNPNDDIVRRFTVRTCNMPDTTVYEYTCGSNLISVPHFESPEVRYEPTSVMFTDDKDIFRWEENGDGLWGYSNPWMIGDFDFEIAAGYWILSENPFNIEVPADEIDLPYDLHLHQGMNLVGCPYPVSFHKDVDIEVITQGRTLRGFSKAAEQGILENVVYMWNACRRNYVETEFIHPWYGYWVYVHAEDVTLRFNRPHEARAAGFAGSHRSEDDALMRILFSAVDETSQDVITRIGIAEDALDSRDMVYDHFKPGNIGNNVEVRVVEDEAVLNSSFKAPITGYESKEWNIEVSGDGQIAFGWEIESGENFNLFMVDENGVKTELTTEGEILLPDNDGKTHFLKIVAENDVPYELDLGVFPNPFKSSTSISFEAKEGMQADVSVYNVQGRHVANIFSGNTTSGENRISWNAENIESGVYLVRIQVDDKILTKKAILVK